MSVGVCQPASCSSAIATTAHAVAHGEAIAPATMTARRVCPLGNESSNATTWRAP